MAGRTDRLLYRHADVLLIRTTTCQDGLTFPADPDLDGAPEEVLARASAWLERCGGWTRSGVRPRSPARSCRWRFVRRQMAA